MAAKQCQECKRKLMGRADKKFCSDQCRTTHNNRLNSDRNKLMRNINNLLRRNRRILESLNPKGKTKVSKTRLLEEGFKFNYFTNEWTTGKGKLYRYVYDYGYTKINDNTYFLVVREDYVD